MKCFAYSWVLGGRWRLRRFSDTTLEFATMPTVFAFISADCIFARFIFLFCMSHFVNSLSAHVWVQVCEPLKRLTVRSGYTAVLLVLCDGLHRDCSARLGRERRTGLDTPQGGRSSCNLVSVVNYFMVFRTLTVELHTKRDLKHWWLWSTGLPPVHS